MIHITSLDDGLELFKALGSDIRIQILKILLENNQMSMNQLANELNISNGALTGHIKKLEEVRTYLHLKRFIRSRQSETVFSDSGSYISRNRKANRLKQRIQHLHQGRAVLISQRLSNLWHGYILICDRRAR